MLANGRPEMVKRAVKSFRAQTYEDKDLVIFNSGNRGDFAEHESDEVTVMFCPDCVGKSIGHLRNSANAWSDNTDIICHWDSDDWSHPNRIAEQVALLQSSGAECVGYNEMLFWQLCKQCHGFDDYCADVDLCETCQGSGGQAWIWRENIKNYAVGTSMMYWRETWERAPFPDYSEGCDDLYWAHGDKKKGIAAVKIASCEAFGAESSQMYGDTSCPRMIASIHGGNTCAKIDAKANAWRRVPEWDAYCREMMKL